MQRDARAPAGKPVGLDWAQCLTNTLVNLGGQSYFKKCPTFELQNFEAAVGQTLWKNQMCLTNLKPDPNPNLKPNLKTIL